MSNVDNSEIIRKLRFLPREELAELAIKVYSSDDIKFKETIKKVAQKNVRKTASYIVKYCNSEKCISIISEYGDLPNKYIKTIEKLYDEYLYGQNPNLYFSQIISPEWKEFSVVKTSLPPFMEDKSVDMSIEAEDKYKDFVVSAISKSDEVIEVLFEYQKRIDYIDPETSEPAYVYTLEEGIIWMVKSLNALITKSSEYAVSSFINKIMEEYLSCRVRRFTLHKNVINYVLGTDTIKSGNYVNLNPDPDEIEGKTIRDEKLMTKSEGRDTDEKYDRKSSFHKIDDITDSKTGLNVNSQIGKISIRAHLKKSELRDWSLQMINRIIDEMTSLKERDIDTYIKGIQLEDIETLREVRKTGKTIVRDTVVSVNKVKSKGITNINLKYSVNELYTNLRNYFNFVFLPTCNTCGSNSYVCSVTGKHESVVFEGNDFSTICSSCGEIIEDISNHFECNCGRPLEGGFDENIIAIPNNQFVNLINSTVDEIGLKYKLDSNELLKFSNGNLEIIKRNYKYLYTFDELPAFEDIAKFDDIESSIAKAQLQNVKLMLKEKCQNYKDSNCRDCLIDRKGHCLQRVIAFFTQGDLHAHSPVEFGDVSFRQDIAGSSELIVCLAKSYNGAPKASGDDRKYTMKNNGGLMNQVVESIFDSRIVFVGIISGADLDPRLKESILNLVKLKEKKIVFIEKMDLVRILSAYEW